MAHPTVVSAHNLQALLQVGRKERSLAAEKDAYDHRRDKPESCVLGELLSNGWEWTVFHGDGRCIGSKFTLSSFVASEASEQFDLGKPWSLAQVPKGGRGKPESNRNRVTKPPSLSGNFPR